MSSQGAMWNTDPVPIGEKMMGEYLRPLGMRTAVVGKTDHRPDITGMNRLGVDSKSDTGKQLAHRDFDPYDLDRGIHPYRLLDPSLKYNQYLREQGYEGENPWHDYTQAVIDDEGNVRNGWIWSNSKYPSRLPEEHSESAYVTNRAMQFMDKMSEVGEPWCLHLGYFKPHWPYVAPTPYHNMYSAEDMLPANRTEAEREHAHPMIAAYHELRLSKVWSKKNARETIIPAYMGLVKQMDDQFGRLLDYMRENGLLDNTLIVFTSDHGDNLGDHWAGEKDLPYDCAARVPFIVYDPSPEADATRGTTETRLVEQIDILPTFIETAGGELEPHSHLLEGRSLRPLLHGEQDITWREYAVSEMNFNGRDVWRTLNIPHEEARAYMIRDAQWKYTLYEGFRPQLFDMLNDPDEQNDLGESPEHEDVRRRLHEELFRWLRMRKHRVTVTYEEAGWRYGSKFEDGMGILIGWWDE